MNRIMRTSLSFVILLILSACLWFNPVNPANPDVPVVRLTVATQNAVTTFSKVGDVITYNYAVTNTGISPLAGPVTITDAPRQPTCPAVNTVGNQDSFLDLSETVTCTATYSISDSDFNTGSVTNIAQATVGGQISNQAGVTLTRSGTPQPSAVMSLAKSANPQTYSQVGQTITYTYVITNVGTAPLGPAQFMITDSRLGAAFACGQANTTIAPNQPLNCTAPYIITQADMTVTSLTNTAVATGAGQTSAAASATITNSVGVVTVTPTGQPASTGPCANLPVGSTCQHQVAVGEWMIQIARCYGARWEDIRDANRQISDPNLILPSMILTVPRIGSVGRIYGTPCVVFHPVQSGDTWASIAQQYNADIVVLQKVNPGGLVPGKSVKVPRNSAGGVGTGATAIPPTVTTPVTNVPAQRITFETGKTTASMIGIINPNQTVQFVLNAAQGQVLSIQLTAPANEVAIGVNGPTGIALKPFDASPIWSTTVTNSGDHLITLASIAGNTSKSYTLQVSLTAAAAPTATYTPTATVTNTPSTPSP